MKFSVGCGCCGPNIVCPTCAGLAETLSATDSILTSSSFPLTWDDSAGQWKGCAVWSINGTTMRNDYTFGCLTTPFVNNLGKTVLYLASWKVASTGIQNPTCPVLTPADCTTISSFVCAGGQVAVTISDTCSPLSCHRAWQLDMMINGGLARGNSLSVLS